MRLERITVLADTIEAVVRFTPEEPLRTSQVEGLPVRALATLPGLAHHRCDNVEGRPFAEEVRDTELAHLLEHIACELMALSGSPRSLRGETSWDFARDGRGVFRVTLEFDDDLVALGALKAAVAAIDGLIVGGTVTDPASTAASLRRLRSAPPKSV